MKVFILDDYQQAVRELACFSMLKDHEVKIISRFPENTDDASFQIKDAEVIVLIRERTQINEELLSKLPSLKLISQTGKISRHLDLEACNKYKIAVAEGTGSPNTSAFLPATINM